MTEVEWLAWRRIGASLLGTAGIAGWCLARGAHEFAVMGAAAGRVAVRHAGWRSGMRERSDDDDGRDFSRRFSAVLLQRVETRRHANA